MVFTDRSRDPSSFSLPALRVAAGQKVPLTIHSPRPVFVATHWKDRLFLCCGDDCPACVCVPRVIRGYVLASFYAGNRWRPCIVDAPNTSWAQLEGFMRMEGIETMSGMVTECSRARKNSPMRMEPLGYDGVVDQTAVSEHRLMAAIAVLFGLPLPAEAQSLATWNDAIQPAVHFRLREAGF